MVALPGTANRYVNVSNSVKEQECSRCQLLADCPLNLQKRLFRGYFTVVKREHHPGEVWGTQRDGLYFVRVNKVVDFEGIIAGIDLRCRGIGINRLEPYTKFADFLSAL